jgi:hypothetical protein
MEGNALTSATPSQTIFIFNNRTKNCAILAAAGVFDFAMDSVIETGPSQDEQSTFVAYSGTFLIPSRPTVRGALVIEWSAVPPQYKMAVYLFIGKSKFKFFN